MSRIPLLLVVACACAAPAGGFPAAAAAPSDPLTCGAAELRELGYVVTAVQRDTGIVRARKRLRVGGGAGSAQIALRRGATGDLRVQQASMLWTVAPAAEWTHGPALQALEDAMGIAAACAATRDRGHS